MTILLFFQIVCRLIFFKFTFFKFSNSKSAINQMYNNQSARFPPFCGPLICNSIQWEPSLVLESQPLKSK